MTETAADSLVHDGIGWPSWTLFPEARHNYGQLTTPFQKPWTILHSNHTSRNYLNGCPPSSADSNSHTMALTFTEPTTCSTTGHAPYAASKAFVLPHELPATYPET